MHKADHTVSDISHKHKMNLLKPAKSDMNEQPIKMMSLPFTECVLIQFVSLRLCQNNSLVALSHLVIY